MAWCCGLEAAYSASLHAVAGHRKTHVCHMGCPYCSMQAAMQVCYTAPTGPASPGLLLPVIPVHAHGTSSSAYLSEHEQRTNQCPGKGCAEHHSPVTSMPRSLRHRTIIARRVVAQTSRCHAYALYGNGAKHVDELHTVRRLPLTGRSDAPKLQQPWGGKSAASASQGGHM